MENLIETTTIETTTFTSTSDNFKGESWQNAYFELLSIKNTYSFILSLDIKSTAVHNIARLEVVVKRDYAESMNDTLMNLGYEKIIRTNTNTLEVVLEYDEKYQHLIINCE